jgi:Cytochrome c554 and c-prime
MLVARQLGDMPALAPRPRFPLARLSLLLVAAVACTDTRAERVDRRHQRGPTLTPTAPQTSSAPRTTAPPAKHAALRLLDLFAEYGGPVELGAHPRGLTGTAPAHCAGCHAEIAAEWQRSSHARAFTNGVFLAEYLPQAERFCRDCHAPLVEDPRAADAPLLLARGIDCAVCHVRDGHVLGATGSGDAKHAARKDTRLRTSAFCGACHQFDFPEPAPGEPVRYHPGQPLQNTLVEWTKSAYADTSCQACHMPRVATDASGLRTHPSHAFSTFDNPTLLAGAVRVRASARWRGDALEITVSLAPDKIGHAFPTGDMFRQGRLAVSVGSVTQTARLERIFAATIARDGKDHLLGQVDDTRVLPAKMAPPSPHVFRFPRPPQGVTAARWTLTLYRLDPQTARRRQLPDSLVVIPISAGDFELPRRARRR